MAALVGRGIDRVVGIELVYRQLASSSAIASSSSVWKIRTLRRQPVLFVRAGVARGLGLRTTAATRRRARADAGTRDRDRSLRTSIFLSHAVDVADDLVLDRVVRRAASRSRAAWARLNTPRANWRRRWRNACRTIAGRIEGASGSTTLMPCVCTAGSRSRCWCARPRCSESRRGCPARSRALSHASCSRRLCLRHRRS